MTSVNVGGKQIPLVITKRDLTIASRQPGGKYAVPVAAGLYIQGLDFGSYPSVLYVDVLNGDDTNDGSSEAPLRSWNAARTASVINSLIIFKPGVCSTFNSIKR